MNTLHPLAVVALLIAAPALASPPEPGPITVQRALSQGVDLRSIDDRKIRLATSFEIAPGTHTLEFSYAYTLDHDRSAPWVSRFAFECRFDTAGTYVLRSRDSPTPNQTPVIWIESPGKDALACTRLGA